MTTPPQENFTLRAGSRGAGPFIHALERAFGTSAAVESLDRHDSDATEMFEISGQGVTIVVDPIPDDRCNPNAPMHSTYKQGEYRIDLVFETNSNEQRKTAKQLLLKSITDAGLAAVPFKEC